MSRYEVDERVGCVAVVDTSVGDPDAPGLHHDDEGVVRYWSRRRAPKWKKLLGLTPKHACWEVPRRHLRAAQRLAAWLNRREEV